MVVPVPCASAMKLGEEWHRVSAKVTSAGSRQGRSPSTTTTFVVCRVRAASLIAALRPALAGSSMTTHPRVATSAATAGSRVTTRTSEMSGHARRQVIVSSAMARAIPGIPNRDLPLTQPRTGTTADQSDMPSSNTVPTTLVEWSLAFAGAGDWAGATESPFSCSGPS